MEDKCLIVILGATGDLTKKAIIKPIIKTIVKIYNVFIQPLLIKE